MHACARRELWWGMSGRAYERVARYLEVLQDSSYKGAKIAYWGTKCGVENWGTREIGIRKSREEHTARDRYKQPPGRGRREVVCLYGWCTGK